MSAFLCYHTRHKFVNPLIFIEITENYHINIPTARAKACQPIKMRLMFIKVRENRHQGYEVLAVNLNACDKITLNEVVGGFHLVLEKAVDVNLNKQVVIENYKKKADAIHAFENIMKALKWAIGF